MIYFYRLVITRSSTQKSETATANNLLALIISYPLYLLSSKKGVAVLEKMYTCI